MLRILVIDDQSYVCAATVRVLKHKVFDAVAVLNAADGMRQLAQSKFDLAIVDIYMPGVDGVKAIKAIRTNYPDMPVIAMSGVQMPTSGRTALDFLPLIPQMADVVCLQKPFRPNQLVEAIHRASEVARLAKENRQDTTGPRVRA
jgi:DNA-binding NtrC family response regulator